MGVLKVMTVCMPMVVDVAEFSGSCGGLPFDRYMAIHLNRSFICAAPRNALEAVPLVQSEYDCRVQVVIDLLHVTAGHGVLPAELDPMSPIAHRSKRFPVGM